MCAAALAAPDDAPDRDSGGPEEALAAIAIQATDQPSSPQTEGSPGDGGPDGSERATVRAAVARLADPTVAEVVLTETAGAAGAAGPDGAGAAVLGLFAETVEPLAPREARPALRWLRAKAHEWLGDVAAAEATYLEAESLDPRWPLTLLDLARYAGDRGDAERGLALLRRAGAPGDHPLAELLDHFHAVPRPDLGRNQPCWCGSGRKYKKCHLHDERLPLSERAGWLYAKAALFVLESPWQEELGEVAAERARYADSPQVERRALADPLTIDAVLFEGGAFEAFLSTRGVLLPDDERLLAEQWLLIDRSIFEVETVRPGDGFTARDLRTSDRHPVRETTASRHIAAGELICARIVPAEDAMQIFGGLEPVALHQREELLALLDSGPDPLELVAFLTRRFAPPALRNTEGDHLVLCEATLRTDDPASLAAALDRTYTRDDDPDTPRWTEHVTTHGMHRIRAMLRLQGNDLHVHVNSEARLDRVLDTVGGLDPSINVVVQTRQPARDAREAAQLAANLPRDVRDRGPVLDPAEPEVAAILEKFTRGYEQKWLDEPIPALAGHTPRQAAADPTRRDDLIRLLDTFPEPDGPGAMNPTRLRAALDLR